MISIKRKILKDVYDITNTMRALVVEDTKQDDDAIKLLNNDCTEIFVTSYQYRYT